MRIEKTPQELGFESIVRQAEEDRLMQDEDRLYEEAERMELMSEYWNYQND